MKWKVDLNGEQNSAWSISVEGSRKAGEGGLTCFDVRSVIIHLDTRLWSRPSLTFLSFPVPMGSSLLLVHQIIRWEYWTVPL